jgi:hypothetical protein
LSGWLIAILAALGTLLLGVVKADLEDAKVCRWLARHLIYRAALRLPRGERARWREEMIRDVLDLLPGRLPPLLWALDTYVKAGSWAQTRGAPSRWETLIARIRGTWQRLRALPTARARTRSKLRHPAYNRETAQQIMAAAGIDAAPAVGMTAVSTTRSSSTANLGYSPETAAARYRKRLPHLSDEEVLTLLSQSPQDFMADLDRKIARFRRERDRALGLPDSPG